MKPSFIFAPTYFAKQQRPDHASVIESRYDADANKRPCLLLTGSYMVRPFVVEIPRAWNIKHNNERALRATISADSQLQLRRLKSGGAGRHA